MKLTLGCKGLLSNAKLPDIPGIDTFKGHMFHTARWDYQCTGGNPKDPVLTGLEGKKVGIVGTGATCVQALPQVANYAAKVYVFQRTPSAVDGRDNSDTDVNWFNNSVATKAGWHRERNFNFVQHIENNQPKPERNLVDDNWTNMGSYSALIGTAKPVTMENVAEYVGQLHAIDIPRQMKIHARIDGIVRDAATAGKLKPYVAILLRECIMSYELTCVLGVGGTLVGANVLVSMTSICKRFIEPT